MAMNCIDFCVGDRVVVTNYDPSDSRAEIHNGKEGFVVRIDNKFIIVEHDFKFHEQLDSCDGYAPSGNGWTYYPSELSVINFEGLVEVGDLL